MSQPAYEINIDWGWSNYGAPSGRDAARCSDVVINGIRRGNRSAHDCVVACINEWLKNRDFESAIRWLADGVQCHNSDAAANLRQNSGAAVRYAVLTYGPHIPAVAGQITSNMFDDHH